MPPIVYLNSQFLPEEDAFIPISDRGFLFGDGVFTTIRVNEGIPEYLQEHLQKLEKDCEALGIKAKKISLETIKELVERNQATKGVWRLKILFSGGNHSDLNLQKRPASQCLMTLKPYNGHSSVYKVTTFPYPILSPLSAVKMLSMLDRLGIADYALKQEMDDALAIDSQGHILETSFANIFWKVENEIFYPDLSLSVYHGITLEVLLHLFKNLGLKIHSVKAKMMEIPSNAQIYLCNSLKRMVPVSILDARAFKRDLIFEKTVEDSFIQGISKNWNEEVYTERDSKIGM